MSPLLLLELAELDGVTITIATGVDDAALVSDKDESVALVVKVDAATPVRVEAVLVDVELWGSELAIEVVVDISVVVGAIVAAVLLNTEAVVIAAALLAALCDASTALAFLQMLWGPPSARYATSMFSPLRPWLPHAALMASVTSYKASTHAVLQGLSPKSDAEQPLIVVLYTVAQAVGRFDTVGGKSLRVTAASDRAPGKARSAIWSVEARIGLVVWRVGGEAVTRERG